jgi:hypothetical protein
VRKAKKETKKRTRGVATPSTTKKPRGKTPEDALDEIRRRGAAGMPLNSGANRRDWLYSAACRCFGSWGAAVEAAGFGYYEVKMAGLTKADLLRRIQRIAADGKPLRAGQHRLESTAARRLFGTWKAALLAAGCGAPAPYKWTPEAFIQQILGDRRQGLLVNAWAVIQRQPGLYQAGRRRFGSWAKALAAVDAATRTDKRRSRTSSRS